jgi:mono/diheme cytochrome c family protein
MRLKTLGVLITTALALFTMLYWLTDEDRRASREAEQHETLIHYGNELFGAPTPEIEFTANCAQCHGPEGRGGDADALGIAPSLRSPGQASTVDTYASTTGLNYIERVIRKGGVAVSGNPASPMPAWEDTLNEYQIEALVVLVESWLEDPDELVEVPDTPEAGEEVYLAVCAACHQADLAGVPGQFPSLTNIANEVGDDLITDIADLEQYRADHAEDPRAALELWIRDSWNNYNAGNPTQMPQFDEVRLPEDQLRAVITYLLEVSE